MSVSNKCGVAPRIWPSFLVDFRNWARCSDVSVLLVGGGGGKTTELVVAGGGDTRDAMVVKCYVPLAWLYRWSNEKNETIEMVVDGRARRQVYR